MPLYDVVISRAAREYRTVAGVLASTEEEAVRLAMRASRTWDFSEVDDVTRVGLDPAHGDVSEWGSYTEPKARQRLERVEIVKEER
jgi:hypothetical protein